MSLETKCVGLPAAALGLTNCAYVNPEDFARLQHAHPMQGSDAVSEDSGIICSLNGMCMYTIKPESRVGRGEVALGMLQRMVANVALGDTIIVDPVVPPASNWVLGSITFELSLLAAVPNVKTWDGAELSRKLKQQFGKQVFKVGQYTAIVFDKTQIKATVKAIEHLSPEAMAGESGGGKHDDDDVGAAGGAGGGAAAGGGSWMGEAGGTAGFGQIVKGTDVIVTKAKDASFKITGTSGGGQSLFSGGFNFEKLGIGGLDNEFQLIFRRAFASRVYPTEIMAAMGIKHVRGMLLYGPPGCGKTLIARQIGKALNSHEPKIVNGPEILNKYVGASEENIRALFKDAEDEQAESGDDSMLHIIIFDEIDAICKSRGSSRDGTGVHDSIVNQLLSKIDGVDSLNNVLLIGMTNRKDMIDEALLRPGRLELHVEIGLPNEHGRVQILNIHTAGMRAKGYLDEDTVDIKDLAKRAKNYTGAEIEGLVKAASSFAFARCVDPEMLGKGARPDFSKVKVTGDDFDRAFEETHPAFGMEEDALALYYRNGIIPYGSPFDSLQSTLRRIIKQVKTSKRSDLVSVLLSGDTGCGKSALSAMIGKSSGFPFVKRIGADTLISYGESRKADAIVKAFEDAYKSSASLIILDDIERIIEYVSVGHRFSNTVLQTLLVLIRRPPPTEGRRMMILATTSVPDVLDTLELLRPFHLHLTVPALEDPAHIAAVLTASEAVAPADVGRISEAFTEPVPIARLLMTIEMARQERDIVDYESFMACAIETRLL